MLGFVVRLLQPMTVTGASKDLYRGVFRMLLILHHDFPEFLADNHFRLCNVIPPECSQIRNLILSAYPSSILELPDPFVDGMKADRLEDIKRSPTIHPDVSKLLREAGLKEILDSTLRSKNFTDENIKNIVDTLHSASESSSEAVDPALLHALVIYIGEMASSNVITSLGAGSSFSTDGPHASLVCKLAETLPVGPRYYYLGALLNQLRYPNNHTWFFSSTLLHLFGNNQTMPNDIELRQQITRVLLERLIVHRPHPWGLIITLLELTKNPIYTFWDQPFVKNNPEVSAVITPFATVILYRSRPNHFLYADS